MSNILLTPTHNPLPAWKELDEVLDVFYNETSEVEVLSSIDTKQKNGKVEPAWTKKKKNNNNHWTRTVFPWINQLRASVKEAALK